MELVEREGFLEVMQTQFRNIEGGEGHCVFVSGGGGLLAKRLLVKKFL